MKLTCRIAGLALLIAAGLRADSELVTLQSWRSQDGDNPEWARPDFDDSAWPSSTAPRAGRFGEVHNGITWYRTTFAVPEKNRGSDMAIGIGSLDEAYDVFVQGERVGRFGRWEPRPAGPRPRHLAFRIPGRLLTKPVAHIAIRRWRGGAAPAWLILYATGSQRIVHAPIVGTPLTIASAEQLHTLTGIINNLPWIVSYLLVLLAGAVSFAFYSGQRRHIEYLLVGIYCVCFGAPLLAVPLLESDSIMLRSPIPVVVVAVSFTFALPNLILARLCPRYRRFLIGAAIVVAIVGLSGPLTLATGSNAFVQIYRWHLRFLPVPYLVALWGLRKGGEQGSMLIAASLSLFSVADGYRAALHLNIFPAGPFSIDPRSVAQLLFVCAMLVVLYKRFRKEQSLHAVQSEDFAAARRMQEMLLAPRTGGTPGYEVDAAYIPDREVGGDFHQEIPGEDGSLLVVAGDVSGKGLPAAMLVSAVIGVLGDLPSRRPAEVLSHLNRSLVGRARGGFVTCSCALLHNGTAIIANAGHIPPYLDGEPIDIESGLPLGLILDSEYAEATVATGGRSLLFVSDGVVEAANSKGELFGFERTASIATQSARPIAEAARAWGQNDDITVVTVRPA